MDGPHIPHGAYGITVTPADAVAEVTYAGEVIARSARAKIMHETRLPAALYVPREDVIAPLRATPARRTFCPFKGTASYWDVTMGGEERPAAAWSYERPLKEAERVKGHIAFGSDAPIAVNVGGVPLPLPREGHINGPLVDWLMREAPLIATPEDLTRALGHELNTVGVWVSRLSVLTWSLHPLIAGHHYVWTKDDDQVDTRAPSYDFIDQPKFANSPLRHVAYRLGGVRQRLDGHDSEFSFAFIEELRAAGATDYVAMPLIGSAGFGARRFNVLSLVGHHPQGFTTANLGHVYECSYIIARLYEAFTQRQNFTSLLGTYLGPRTGARVLSGEIRRGDGDEIDAAILFCDLRGSTQLEAELPRADFFAVLNHFFEVADAVVRDNGGEVLKFIGDAVMAVFPAADADEIAGNRPSCRNAIHAAQTIVTTLQSDQDRPLDCGIGIAFGNVTYGNIGSLERLDFTVIGAAANIAARLSDYGKANGHCVVVSGDVLGCADGNVATQPLGAITLRGVPNAIEAHAVPQPTSPPIHAPVTPATAS